MVGTQRKVLNLALQGGGSHGAFAWGVLDRLLEDDRIDIASICATSAGTMNALALAHGLNTGETTADGRALARKTLETFWSKISGARYFYGAGDAGLGQTLSEAATPAWWFLENTIKMMSPYLWNTFSFNPLRNVLEDCIDFEGLRSCDCIKLFISATNVRSGKVRVFDMSELSVEVALASACLPFLFKAVEIDGEHYWDGGYMGNPALFPLLSQDDSRDLLIVHINPIDQDSVPKQSAQIMNRLNEITFNAALLNEMRSIALLKKLARMNYLTGDAQSQIKDILVHSIRAEDAIGDLADTSKLDTSWTLICELKARGREAMETWLGENFDALGERDTVDLDQEFAETLERIFP